MLPVRYMSMAWGIVDISTVGTLLTAKLVGVKKFFHSPRVARVTLVRDRREDTLDSRLPGTQTGLTIHSTKIEFSAVIFRCSNKTIPDSTKNTSRAEDWMRQDLTAYDESEKVTTWGNDLMGTEQVMLLSYSCANDRVIIKSAVCAIYIFMVTWLPDRAQPKHKYFLWWHDPHSPHKSKIFIFWWHFWWPLGKL